MSLDQLTDLISEKLTDEGLDPAWEGGRGGYYLIVDGKTFLIQEK